MASSVPWLSSRPVVRPAAGGEESLLASDLRVGQCVNHGWLAFTSNMKPALLGSLVYLLLLIPSFIPFVGVLYIFVSAPLMGGWARFGLNLIRRRSPRVSDLWSGFNRYGAYLGASFLHFLVGAGCMLPSFLVSAVMQAASGSGSVGVLTAALVLTGLLGLAGIVVSVVLGVRWGLVAFVLAEDNDLGVLEAFHRSARLTTGHRGTLFLLGLAFIPVLLAGVFCLGVGILAAAPIAMGSMASAYLRLTSRERSGYAGRVPVAQEKEE